MRDNNFVSIVTLYSRKLLQVCQTALIIYNFQDLLFISNNQELQTKDCLTGIYRSIQKPVKQLSWRFLGEKVNDVLLVNYFYNGTSS